MSRESTLVTVFGGANDVLFSIDTDLAKPYWTADMTYAAATGSDAGTATANIGAAAALALAAAGAALGTKP